VRKVFLICLFLLGLVVLIFGIFNKNAVSVVSPLGQGVGGDKIYRANDWFPKLDEYPQSNVDVSAESAILVDYDSGEVIFAKGAKDRMPVASTVKIMTALVALERKKLMDEFTVSKGATEVGEDTMGLSEGEVLRFGDLMYGLLLPSGNDVAVTIAEGVDGTEDMFVVSMNKKAESLGLVDTKFINASGLDVDGERQYSTAFDLATIARFTWENHKEFRRVSETDYKFIEATNTHKAFDLYNDTNLLTTYPGVKGIKPGFTWEAGYCLVTYAENNGVKLLGVILNSQDRRVEMTRLLDFGFSKYGLQIAHPALP